MLSYVGLRLWRQASDAIATETKSIAMSQHAKTDDEIGLNQKYREKAEWIERFLGMKVPVRDRLDLADTTTAESAQNAVPVILGQVKDMMAPLSTGPKADVSELRLALSNTRRPKH